MTANKIGLYRDGRGVVQFRPNDGSTEAVRRFRDHKALMREWFPGEVTNEAALSVLLDVYALHAEREGREDIAAAARRPVATDGGTVK